ncbi:MAG TPA: allophanate hydrolase [Reyranella sp.]|nr:allophanate hydrolase [Reyranella sp.]
MTIDLGIHRLRAAYTAGTLTCRAVIDEVLSRIAAAGQDNVWISRLPDADLRQAASALDARRGEIDALPLYGVPFAVKDNIDVAGMTTTAACPGFAYIPEASAEAVRQLVEAGAIMVGKTNLDQFATGLVGVRSPYGVPRNPFDAEFIPGGSSSGSAVAVSSGLVSFSLGTDTAGSGRIPAGFNNVVGLKPTPGAISTEGVVPACRSLDCVSLFTLSCVDAALVWQVIGNATWPAPKESFRFGVPRQLEFFGDTEYAALYAEAIQRLQAMGGEAVAFDYTPFNKAAELLYNGPWVAERTAAVGAFIAAAGKEAGVWPVTRDIILAGREYSAVDAFEGQYELHTLRAQAEHEMKELDFLALPTAGTIYRVADLRLEPVLYNSNLGYYTNFVNFFRLSGLALPSGFRKDGLPFGITLIAGAYDEEALLRFGARWQERNALPLGRTASALPPADAIPPHIDRRVSLVVVGAHMSGLPLNPELLEREGQLEAATRTAPLYRLYALPGGPPARPGLVRTASGGAAIDVEVWSLPAYAFGRFVQAIPEPLGIGRVQLEDGTTVQGFLCEAYATADAQDITSFGGWRAYLKSLA